MPDVAGEVSVAPDHETSKGFLIVPYIGFLCIMKLEEKHPMRELSRGDIPVIILEVLSQGPYHGYAIAREIERQSEQALKLREGSLYPALRVLESDGLIESEWEIQNAGPARKTYRLTAAGHAELTKRKEIWQRYVKTVGQFLGGIHEERTT
jgi:PadR family transcriptional regulator PadR